MDADRKNPPSGWLDALAESEAELAAGQSVSLEAVLRGLHESLVRIQVKDGQAAEAAPRR